MSIDGKITSLFTFIPFAPVLHMIDNGHFNTSNPLFRHSILCRHQTELPQCPNNIPDDGIRPAYAIVMGKLDNVFTGNISKFCPDVQTVVFVGKITTAVNNIGNIVGW